jgi:protein-S-isoprenylcysteine O-methyltransferase Ste14
MDVKGYDNKMKLACPVQKQLKCLVWEKAILLLVVFLAVYATVSHSFNHAGIIEVLLSITATAAVLWCLWVVKTFRDIMTWWVNIQQKVDSACNLLTETKQEIKELKLIKQGK